MKEYNREKKIWEEKTTGQGKFKTRDKCKGGREHDYILCLPSWVHVNDSIIPQAVEEFYASEERRRDFDESEGNLLATFGIVSKRYGAQSDKHYRCSVCEKREIKHKRP